jgi:hypothetical protein
MDGGQGWDAPPRGPRYSLQLPAWFRMAGETDWHVGTTEYVSPSGLIVRAGDPPAPGSRVDVVVALPPAGFESSGCLVGRGLVVGAVGPSPHTGQPTFAVTLRLRLTLLHRALDAPAR